MRLPLLPGVAVVTIHHQDFRDLRNYNHGKLLSRMPTASPRNQGVTGAHRVAQRKRSVRQRPPRRPSAASASVLLAAPVRISLLDTLVLPSSAVKHHDLATIDRPAVLRLDLRAPGVLRQLEPIHHSAEFCDRCGLDLPHHVAAVHLHRGFGDAHLAGNLLV